MNRLFYQIILIFSFIVFFTSLILTFILSRINVDSLKTFAKEYAIATSDEISKDLKTEIEEIKNILQSIVEVFNDRKKSVNEKIDFVKILLHLNKEITYLAIYDENGQFIDNFYSKNIKIRKEIKEVLNSKKEISFSIFFPENDTFPIFEIILPWFNQNQLLGYLVAGISLNFLSYNIKKISERRFGINDLIFIVNKDGTIIAHPEKQLIGKNIKEFEIHRKLKDFHSIFLAEVGLLINNVDYKKRKVVTTIISLPSIEWAIFVSQLEDKVYGNLKRLFTYSFFSFVFSLLISLILSIFSSRYLTKPLEELKKGIERIEEKDFEYALKVKVKNEIGKVANSFNRMVEKLKYYKEEIKKETAIKTYFLRHLPPHIVSEIKILDKTTIFSEPIEKIVSVMFADIKDFTSISEKLSPPRLASFLNKYFKVVTECIFKYNGVVDKFIGDSAMVLFGIVGDTENTSDSAILAAREIVRKLNETNEELFNEFGHVIKVKIGISTGLVFVGDIGAENRLDYTAIGKTVNIASRLEEIAGENEILIDENTKNKLTINTITTLIGEISLKGIKEKIKVYKVSE
ncbi:MAG: adenylate/guanylate cyclase domain-containing protein [Candidatus Hydrothermales bacterium]